MKNQYYDFIYEKVGENVRSLVGVRQSLNLIWDALINGWTSTLAATDALGMVIDHLDKLSEYQGDILEEATHLFEQSEAVSV